jgi:hypothetical protein
MLSPSCTIGGRIKSMRSACPDVSNPNYQRENWSFPIQARSTLGWAKLQSDVGATEADA